MKQSVYRGLMWRLRRQVERLEALGLEQYMLYVSDTKRFFWRNFMAGLARGLGGAVGFTILGAVLAEIVEIVQRDLGKR